MGTYIADVAADLTRLLKIATTQHAEVTEADDEWYAAHPLSDGLSDPAYFAAIERVEHWLVEGSEYTDGEAETAAEAISPADVRSAVLGLMGDGQGNEVEQNPEYTRACIEVAHDLGVSIPGHPYETRPSAAAPMGLPSGPATQEGRTLGDLYG